MAMMDNVCQQLNIPASAYVNIESCRNRRVRNVVGNVDRFNPDEQYYKMNDDLSKNSDTIKDLSDVEETLCERGDLYGEPEDTVVYNAEQLQLVRRRHVDRAMAQPHGVEQHVLELRQGLPEAPAVPPTMYKLYNSGTYPYEPLVCRWYR